MYFTKMKIKYKGFVAEFFFCPEANSFCGEVLNTVDLITFQVGNPQDALRALQESVDRYLSYVSKTP
jgi:predicted HicB family RNase H-like nuclease